MESGLFRNLTHQVMFVHGAKVNQVFSLNAVIKMVLSMEITALLIQQMKELLNNSHINKINKMFYVCKSDF